MSAPSLADFEALAPTPAPPGLADFAAAPPANDPPAVVREVRVAKLSADLNALLHPLGLFKRTAFAEYLAAPGTNASKLKDLAHSPRLYHHKLTVPEDATDPMRLGSCAHTAILEPKKFLSEYALWDERTEGDADKVSPRRGKKWDAFVLANPGKTIVRADEHALAMAMRDAVHADPRAAKYLRAGDPEVAMWWADAATERLCKGRADWITTLAGEHVLVGLKTARDCRRGPFSVAAAKLGYALQWAFYADGYRAITGVTPRMVEIVVESEAPHDVAVYRITDAVLETGRREIARLLALLGRCEKANAWPGAEVEEQDLVLPVWATSATGAGDAAEAAS